MHDDDCMTCQHRKECENNYGKLREDGDDFRAVWGTHFCRASWQQFIDDGKKIHKENSK